MPDITGKKVAILAADGVEEVELTEPLHALTKAGAVVTLVSLHDGDIQSMQGDVTPAGTYKVDQQVSHADAADFDALVLPGGTTNPDKLRMDRQAVNFVRRFVETDKPIAAICHGAWTLIDAGGVKGLTVTSWPSLQQDLRNAGATWVDRSMVQDGKLVTSRNPKDLPAFCKGMIELFAAA